MKQIFSTFNFHDRRPQRTSKQKALNQVKVWCGDISDADETSGKRKFSEDDSDSDSFEKKMKFEESDSSEDEQQKSVKPTITIKKINKSSTPNGVGGKKTTLPGKILIPDSQGIVRINQKEASELSSGVYIMSKTAGIIKLDSSTSKLATSGGQTIVRVAPKIGQTQIKVVKKDHQSNIIRITPKLSPKSKQGSKVITKTYSRSNQERKPIIKATVPAVEKKVEPEEDEESDGVPELEFPTDLPLPEPDSPPGEFILDPSTGKLAGQEYPEVTDDVQLNKNEDLPENRTVNGLENLVKIAAADILEEELKKLSQDDKENEGAKGETESANVKNEGETENVLLKDHKLEHEKLENNRSTESYTESSTEQTTAVVSETPKPVFKTKSASNAPYNKTGSSILQKKLLSSPSLPQHSTPNKILNKSQSLSSVKRSTPSSVRNRIISPKGKVGLPQYPPTITRVRQSYSNKNLSVARKIGQTTIYRTKSAPVTKVVEKHPLAINSEISITEPSPISNTIMSVPLMPSKDSLSESQSIEQTVLGVPDTLTDLASLAELSDAESPLIITGEDGTIYQVAGQDEQGQTILISQGADGQSQCLVVATEGQQLEESQLAEMPEELQQPLAVVEDSDGVTESADDTQVVAQLISADPPSPGEAL